MDRPLQKIMQPHEIWITLDEYHKHTFHKGSTLREMFNDRTLHPKKEYDNYLREVVLI